MSEPLTSVSTLRRSSGVSGDNVVMEGSREMNSGINLYIRVPVRSGYIVSWEKPLPIFNQVLYWGTGSRPSGLRTSKRVLGGVDVPAGSTWSRTFGDERLFGVKNGKNPSDDSSCSLFDARFAVKPIDWG